MPLGHNPSPSADEGLCINLMLLPQLLILTLIFLAASAISVISVSTSLITVPTMLAFGIEPDFYRRKYLALHVHNQPMLLHQPRNHGLMMMARQKMESDANLIHLRPLNLSATNIFRLGNRLRPLPNRKFSVCSGGLGC